MAKTKLTRADFDYINEVAEGCGTSDRFWDEVLHDRLYGEYIDNFINDLDLEDTKEIREIIFDCFMTGDIPNDEYFK